jgi:hypothetical protein
MRMVDNADVNTTDTNRWRGVLQYLQANRYGGGAISQQQLEDRLTHMHAHGARIEDVVPMIERYQQMGSFRLRDLFIKNELKESMNATFTTLTNAIKARHRAQGLGDISASDLEKQVVEEFKKSVDEWRHAPLDLANNLPMTPERIRQRATQIEAETHEHEQRRQERLRQVQVPQVMAPTGVHLSDANNPNPSHGLGNACATPTPQVRR